LHYVKIDVDLTLGAMSESLSAPPKPRCTACIATLLIGLLVSVFTVGWVVMVIQKVFGGAAMEHCCTIEGVPFNYLAVFVFMCGLAVALLFAVVLQFRDCRIRRAFERKYGVKVPASGGSAAPLGGSDSGPSLHGVEYSDGD
jgi:hypothetical protein